MPQTVNDLMRADIDKTVLKTLTVSWSSEDDGMYDDSGSGLYTFSANRESYESYALAALQSDVANIKTAISTTVPLAVRMACTLDIFPYTRLLQSDLEVSERGINGDDCVSLFVSHYSTGPFRS